VVHGQPSGDLCVDELDGAVRIIANLGHFLGNSGYADVAFPLALQVIDSHEQTPSRDLVVAMANTSRMMTSTRPEVALTLIARAEALARELGDEEAMGRVLIRKGSLGLAHYGTDERTRATIEGGIAHLRSSGALDWRNWYYNLALCCIELGDLAEAERLAELRLRAEQEGLTEGEGWTEFLFGTLCGVRGQIAEAAEWFQRAALREEENGMPAHAEGTWTLASLYQSSIGRLDEASTSIRRSRTLAELTGTPPSRPHAEEIRIDALSGRYEEALYGASRWFQGVHRMPSVASETGQAHLAGEAAHLSGFLLVLLAVATSWAGLGSPDLACLLVASAPSLLEQTKFNAWAELGDTARWEDLRSRTCQDAEPVRISLQQAFDDTAARLLADRAPQSQ
jgi:tetratricopeptide (TPR) repeat protein